MDALPDELVREILTPLLYIDKITFESVFTRSPFAFLPQSSSDLLCICKAWMRVTTPPLYNTIILRSKAQAYTLQRTLRANKDFGAYVGKLRVEGGAMKTVLTLAPKITHIWLTLDLPGRENTTGLCNSLAMINPRRVTLQNLSDLTRNTAPSRKLHTKLCDSFEVWSDMRHISLPWEGFHQETYLTGFIDRLGVQNLETIGVNKSIIFSDLQTLAKIASLKLILIRGTKPTDEGLSFFEGHTARITRGPHNRP